MHLFVRRALGVLALGGSFTGLATGIGLMVDQQVILAKLLTMIFLGLYCWGVWCGICMLEGMENAIRVNRIFWAFQIPYFMSPIVGYLFSSGALLFVTYNPTSASFGYFFRFGGQFQYSLLQTQTPFVLGINLVAVAAYIFLTYCVRREVGGRSTEMTRL